MEIETLLDRCSALYNDLHRRPIPKNEPYVIICNEKTMRDVITKEGVTYYNKSINQRIEISKKIGYCCIVKGIQLWTPIIPTA